MRGLPYLKISRSESAHAVPAARIIAAMIITYMRVCTLMIYSYSMQFSIIMIELLKKNFPDQLQI
jgi:hypothetical protein